MSTTFATGSEFCGYRIQALLGRGGMGLVYGAEDILLKRKVALKVLAPEVADDEALRERFILESQLAAAIEHPNIIPIYGADDVEGVLFIAMRYVEGLDLRSLIEQEVFLDLERTVVILEQVARALDAAHSRDLVHRDVKPANVLLAEGDHVYLTDFGIAKRASAPGLTQVGFFMGTPDYAAPEQIQNLGVSARSDVYAFGAMLFECVTGQKPFVRDTDEALLDAQLHDQPPALADARPGVPPGLDGIVAKAMAKSPQERYASCGELVFALRGVLESLSRPIAAAQAAPRPAAAPPAVPDSHLDFVVRALLAGKVVPLLGEGASLYERPGQTVWERGRFLPSGEELAAHLATSFQYPPDRLRDLLRVSQYASVMAGIGPLYDTLHELFDADYPPTAVHRFLAALPRLAREADGQPRHLLIVTTNVDDALESAFRAEEEPLDLVAYAAEGEFRGHFVHWPPDGEPRPIDRPNEYRDVSLEQRTVVLKLHGLVDRTNPDSSWDSFVITEDHYIDYLTRADLASLVPVGLAAKLRKSHFLFLGYSMRDWNLRVILHRIWGAEKLGYKSWAVQPAKDAVERELWQKRGVETLDVPLADYVAALEARVRAAAVVGGAR